MKSKVTSAPRIKPAQSRGMSASLRRLALRRVAPLLTASALLLAGQSAFAANKTWNGGGTDDNWTTALNWTGGAPVANDSLFFAGTTRLTPNNNIAANTQFASLTFNAGAGTFTLGGNVVKIAGAVTNNSGVLQILNMDINLQNGGSLVGDGFELKSGHQLISGQAGASTATIYATGLILDPGSTLNAFGGRTLNQDTNSTITSGQLTVFSTGTYNLKGTNSYAGGTLLRAGTINIGNTSALGVSTGDLTFSRNTLDFDSALNLNGVNIGVGNLSSTGTVRAANITTTGGPSTLTIGNGNATGGNYAGTITGAVGITKTGNGTLTLSGADTYTGATTINSGTLQFAKSNSLSSSTSATNFIVNSGGTATFNVGGTGEYTSANLDAFQTLGTGAGGFQTGSFLGLDTTNATGSNFTYASAINNPNGGANALGLSKLGTGSLTLTGTSTYTGATNINAGTLVLDSSPGNTGALGNTAVSVNAGTTLLVKGTTNIGNAPGGTLTLAGGTGGTQGNLDLRDGAPNTLTLGGGLTLGSVAGGSTLFLDLGASNGINDQIMAGGALAATGTNTINLNLLSTLASGTTQYTLISAASGVDFNNFTLGTKPTGFNTFTLTSPGATALVLTAQANATQATAYWTGLASATGAPPDPNNNWGYGSALTPPKSNWSTTADGLSDPVQVPGLISDVYFTAANASNANNSTAGTLATQLDGDYSIQSLTFDTSPQTTAPITSVAINTNGHTLTLDQNGQAPSGQALTVAATDNSSSTISNTGAGGGVALGTSQNWANNNNAQSLTVSAAVNGTAAGALQTLTLNGTGTGGVALSGPIGNGSGVGGTLALAFGQAGTTTLSGNNTFTGGVTINSGTVQLGSAGALNTAAPNAVTFGPNSSSVLQLNGNSVAVSGLNTDPTTTGTPAVENSNATAATLTVNDALTNAYAGVLRDGTAGTLALTKSGAGTLTLTGANTYTGGTNFNGGVLNVGVAEAAGSGPLGASGPLTFSGGTLQYSAANQNDYSNRFSTTNVQAYNIDTNGQNVALATGLTSSSGGTLTKAGTGVLTLNANATYTGTTTINGGTLIVSPGGNSSGGGIQGAITVNNGGTLVIGSTNALIGNANTGTASVRVNTGGVLTTADGVTTHAGNIALNGGTLASGVPDPAFGSFDLVSGKAITSVSGSASTSTISATGLNLETGSTLNAFFGTTFNITGTITQGQLTTGSVGLVTLSGANTYTGGTTIKAGTLQLINAGTLGASTSNLTFDRSSFSSVLDMNGTSQGVGNLTSTGTAQLATILNNNTGTTSTLTIGNGDATGGNFAGVIADHTTGTGVVALTKSGVGTLTLTGTNTYTGTTTINAGALQIGDGTTDGSINTSANIVDNSALIYNRVGNATYGNVISGTGTVTKTGVGTQTLTGTNGYTGGTTVNLGTLALAAAAADGTGALAINGGTVQTAVAGALGGGSVTLAGGTLQNTVLGAGSAAANTQTSGILTLGTGNSTLDFGAANTGATFQFTSYTYAGAPGTLNVANWMGASAGGGTDQFTFTTAPGNTGDQLANIYFVNPNINGTQQMGTYSALIQGNEIVAGTSIAPTPEPGSIVPIIVGMAGLGVLIARKRRKTNTGNSQNELAEAV